MDNLTDNFGAYADLLRKIKQRVLIARQRVIYAANEEMLRMYWDIRAHYWQMIQCIIPL